MDFLFASTSVIPLESEMDKSCSLRCLFRPIFFEPIFENWLSATVMLLCASYTEAPDASGR